MIALFVILVVAALVATACEPRIVAHVKGLAYKEDYALVTEVYRGPAWLRCFSLVKNYDQWLSRREDNPLSCLDGVRVVSMLMVIHGHTLLFGIYGMYTNLVSAILPPDGLMSTARGQSLLSDEFAVDSFFWLSGLLATRALVKYAQGRGWKWIPQSYLFRYLRLTPLYGFVLFFWWKALRAVGRGPLWLGQGGLPALPRPLVDEHALREQLGAVQGRRLPSSASATGGTSPTTCSFLSSCLCLSWRIRITGGRGMRPYSSGSGPRSSTRSGAPATSTGPPICSTGPPPVGLLHKTLDAHPALPRRFGDGAPPERRVVQAVSPCHAKAMKLVALLILGLCYFGAYPFYQIRTTCTRRTASST